MKLSALFASALVAAAAVAAQPAVAYPIAMSGRTLATPQLAADVIGSISRYSKATGGCSFVFSARTRVLPAVAATPRGGHVEEWTVNACAARQRFQVAMWPSPRGGSDFAIVPLTGRMPLHVR